LGAHFFAGAFRYLASASVGARFGVNLPDMSDLSDLYVEVHGAEIIVALPHSTHSPTYRQSTDSRHLILTDASSPEDPGSTMTPAEFLGLAWQAANAKARELGGLCR
jgi:hypothetical protein